MVRALSKNRAAEVGAEHRLWRAAMLRQFFWIGFEFGVIVTLLVGIGIAIAFGLIQLDVAAE